MCTSAKNDYHCHVEVFFEASATVAVLGIWGRTACCNHSGHLKAYVRSKSEGQLQVASLEQASLWKGLDGL